MRILIDKAIQVPNARDGKLSTSSQKINWRAYIDQPKFRKPNTCIKNSSTSTPSPPRNQRSVSGDRAVGAMLTAISARQLTIAIHFVTRKDAIFVLFVTCTGKRTSKATKVPSTVCTPISINSTEVRRFNCPVHSLQNECTAQLNLNCPVLS